MYKKIIFAAGCAAVILLAVIFLWTRKTGLPAVRPDAIATGTAANGDVLVENRTSNYAVAVPPDWYMEKSAGAGMALYPDYDESGAVPPACKVEISNFKNSSREDLSAWLGAHLSSGGNDIRELSEEAPPVPEDAVIWRGVMNGVTTTLAYVASGTEIYEIAPSAVGNPNATTTDNASCENALQTVLENFTIIK